MKNEEIEIENECYFCGNESKEKMHIDTGGEDDYTYAYVCDECAEDIRESDVV